MKLAMINTLDPFIQLSYDRNVQYKCRERNNFQSGVPCWIPYWNNQKNFQALFIQSYSYHNSVSWWQGEWESRRWGQHNKGETLCQYNTAYFISFQNTVSLGYFGIFLVERLIFTFSFSSMFILQKCWVFLWIVPWSIVFFVRWIKQPNRLEDDIINGRHVCCLILDQMVTKRPFENYKWEDCYEYRNSHCKCYFVVKIINNLTTVSSEMS